MAYATINKPNLYFNTVLYTGTGTTNSVTGVNFKPDFVWIKQRSATRSHVLYDLIRGATKDLRSNDTTAEATDAATLSSFNADGFTVVTDDKVNVSSGTYASWNWLGSNTTTNNTAGTISSTVCVNTTSEFSVVSYTGNATSGATVGHGLGVTPKMFIIKSRGSVVNWRVYHTSIGNTAGLALNTTGGSDTNSGFFNNTSPSSTVFTLGDGSTVNSSSTAYIAYCFDEVKGYSAFNKYAGTGNANGPFIYTGFKPAYIMIKRTDSTADWYIQDNVRNQNFNGDPKTLQANTNTSEASIGTWSIDNLSNGFKIRESNAAINASGGTYIYACFAQNPFVGTNNVPTTAR
jgi:hypothetical protein